MNQTPAAILVLASSILAYSATVRAYDPIGVFLGVAAFAVGAWGVISLVRDREGMFDYPAQANLLGTSSPRRPTYANVPLGTPMGTTSAAAEPADIQLSPEVKAHLSIASHLEGRDRSQIVEEALRRYLPRYDRTKAA